MTRRTAKTVSSSGENGDHEFERVAETFADDRQVTTGKMMSSMGLKVNGKIFAMLVRGRLVAKLPKDRVDDLIRSGAGERFDPRGGGRLMKECVVLTSAKHWTEIAKEAHRFVKGKRT